MKAIDWSKLFFIGITLGALLVSKGSLARPEPVYALTLSPTDDVYVDVNNADENFDGQGLDLGYSNFPSFSSAQEAYLKFDLSGLTQGTSFSRLHVTIATNSWDAGSTLDVSLYSLDGDSWDEATVTYNDPPTGSLTLLQTIQVTAATTGEIIFGDPDAIHPVGTYIESQRTGDGVASFLIRLTGGTGLVFAGASTLEDSENSQTPAIQDEPIMPTVITLQAIEANDDGGFQRILSVVILLAFVTTGYLLLRNTRRQA